MMSIGKNIAKYRKRLNLTQEELGLKLGVTNQAVSKWESAVSMPDIMLLPQIVSALGITLDELYGIERETEKVSVPADDFPNFCQKKLIELFYYNANMRFTHIGNSTKEQMGYLMQELENGFRLGCISNTSGAMVVTEDFSFIDCDYKVLGSENVIKAMGDSQYTLMYLSDLNLRKVLFYQYKTAIEKSKANNTEFTMEEIMQGCNLSENEAYAALLSLRDININECYTDRDTQTRKYVFRMSNAVYALTIYKLAGLLSEEPAKCV